MFLFQSGMAFAYLLGGHYQEAVRWAKEAVNEQPSWTTGHRVLVAGLAKLGCLPEAQEAARVLLKFQPNYRIGDTLALGATVGPLTETQYIEGLRLAGLPE